MTVTEYNSFFVAGCDQNGHHSHTRGVTSFSLARFITTLAKTGRKVGKGLKRSTESAVKQTVRWYLKMPKLGSQNE